MLARENPSPALRPVRGLSPGITETPMKPTEITVKAPDATYPILMGENLLKSLPDLLKDHKLTGKVAIVTNDTIAPLYGKMMADTLGATLIPVPDGEQHK